MTTNEIGSRSAKHGHSSASTTTSASSPNGGKKPKKKRIILKIFLTLVALGFIGLLAGITLFWSYAKDAPKLDDEKLSATVSSKIYDADGNIFEELGSEKREMVKPTEVPQVLKDAIVSVEDKRFYKHSGVDPIRIIGSAFSNFRTGGLQGGSTLTQQLIKLSYFSTSEQDQNLKRKAQEAWLAYKLEKEKSKEEILTYYINKVYMANGFYGMETAAENYYGKPLSELTLPQTALLAGMPQAPNDYDPYTKPEVAKERRDVVLYTMKENNKISEKEYEAAKATPINDGLQPLKQTNENRKIVDNYLREVIAEVEGMGKNIYTDGLEIHTNLDMNAQKQLYDVVNTDQYVDYPDADFQVASTVIDVKTGQVKAQIGGRNIPDDVQLGRNRATETKRIDVGSTMKPMADYGPAIEYLNYSTGKILADTPTNYPGTSTPINNADLQFYGNITMRNAIVHSRNTTAVKTFDTVGSDKSAEFLKGIGIEFKELVAANAISSNTAVTDGNKYGVSTLKLASAYASFANNGVYNKPTYVNKIVYQDGSEENIQPENKQVMKDSTAYMMTDMLKDVISSGTAFNAAIPGLIQAGKTGTSNYSDSDVTRINSPYSSIAPDSTFVGYTPHYAVSVWTGYDSRDTPITSEYWKTASDVYREMMTYLSQNVSNEDWTMPDSVIRSGGELYVKGASETPASSATYSTSAAMDSYSIPEPSSTVPSTTSEQNTPVTSEPTDVQQTSSTSEAVTPPSSSETPITPDSSATTQNGQQRRSSG